MRRSLPAHLVFEAARWIVGTSGASCLRLRANADAATVTLIVTAE